LILLCFWLRGQDLLKTLRLKSGYKGVAGAVTIICNLILRFLTK